MYGHASHTNPTARGQEKKKDIIDMNDMIKEKAPAATGVRRNSVGF